MIAALLLLGAAPVQVPDPDAVKAAPANHRVLLENDEVRVLEVIVPPGETEAVHEHRRPGVLLIQQGQPAIDIRYEVKAGKLVEASRNHLPDGPPPPALYAPSEPLHAIQNLGSGPFLAIRVELKRAAAPKP